MCSSHDESTALSPSDLIRRCLLFAKLTDENAALIASIIVEQSHESGAVLFEQGEEARGFYVVVCGKVKIYKLSSAGKERVLHIVQPGESFADAAIFDDGCYPAFAETIMKTTLLFIPKKEFINLLHQHTQLAINMIAGLSRYLRQFIVQIEDMTFRDVPSRLARYLISVTSPSQASFSLPLSKSQLASTLGTTSETLSRTLRKLIDEEMIAVSGKEINILDTERLYELSKGNQPDGE